MITFIHYSFIALAALGALCEFYFACTRSDSYDGFKVFIVVFALLAIATK